MSRLKWQWEFVETEVRDRIGYIWMNRPEKRNALNPQMVKELTEAFTDMENNNAVRVVVLGGKGPAFCAGADLSYLQQLQNATYEENLADSLRLAELFKLIYTLNKPVIACVEGPAMGGGAGLAVVCDFVFATKEAKFGFTEVRIGFIPAIVSVFVVRMVGERKARELLLSGKVYSAEEAQALGLINNVIDGKDIKEFTHTFAVELAKRASGEALARTKWMLSRLGNYGFPQVLEFAAEQNAKARDTRDCKYGISRFLKKEKIEW